MNLCVCVWWWVLVNCRFETELAIRQTVEQDITRLRKLIDETHISRMQLESEIEALMEELMYLKKTHEEVPLKSQLSKGQPLKVQ